MQVLPTWFSKLQTRAESLPDEYRAYALEQCREALGTYKEHPASRVQIAFELTEVMESLEYDIEMRTMV